ncbi:IlvA, Threonine dehydratase [Pyrenophora tritici-repentis]|nr:IlvA, Threonine dehydratase [Pyrenophora tritici-repentis]
MVAKLRAAGAYEVIQYGAAWKDADTYLREHIMPTDQTSTIYCPPFDHPDIWEGNSTCMHEIAAQLPGSEPDVLICSVGGGGLLNGICQAMDSLSMSKTTILAMETAGAESFNAALQAKELITLPKITSQATSLGCARVTDATFKYGQRGNVRSIVLPDAEAAMGCWRLADDERIMVELACGINVALCYDGRLEKALGRPVRPEDKVVIVLCGGSNVTSKMLYDWRNEYAYIEEETEERRKSDSALGSETQSETGSVKDMDIAEAMENVPMRSKQRIDVALKQNAPARIKAHEMYNKPLPRLPLTSHPDGVLYPPLRPRPIQARSESKGKEAEAESWNARKDSDFSQTSYEVPITIDDDIHSTVDASKPLPPASHLSPALKAQKTASQIQFKHEVQPKVKVVNVNRPGGSKHDAEKAGGHTWWKPLPSKAAPSLKIKISYPGPLMASGKGAVVNIATESGGVGGPAAAVSLPVTRTGAFRPQAQTSYDARKQIDKGKMGRKRKSSDASFCCQGVDGELLDRYQVSDQAASDQEDDMLLLPLFSGTRGGRDTNFYQPYVEVLDEY